MITGNWNDMNWYFREKDANAFFIKVKPDFLQTRSEK